MNQQDRDLQSIMDQLGAIEAYVKSVGRPSKPEKRVLHRLTSVRGRVASLHRLATQASDVNKKRAKDPQGIRPNPAATQPTGTTRTNPSDSLSISSEWETVRSPGQAANASANEGVTRPGIQSAVRATDDGGTGLSDQGESVSAARGRNAGTPEADGANVAVLPVLALAAGESLAAYPQPSTCQASPKYCPEFPKLESDDEFAVEFWLDRYERVAAYYDWDDGTMCEAASQYLTPPLATLCQLGDVSVTNWTNFKSALRMVIWGPNIRRTIAKRLCYNEGGPTNYKYRDRDSQGRPVLDFYIKLRYCLENRWITENDAIRFLHQRLTTYDRFVNHTSFATLSDYYTGWKAI
ncbi:hypothetical protein IWQ60_010625 [Tieghemiomyces parasiticus]|uniref:Uncharacterized protein n=1 Tax=Tieghemiomyces parasiticus TaxID=78921 RepID=A0A9W8DNB3_9FUNG|nr:hypothetical protein IWQ60_010625 [Tieghemiomyces parasiticus]